MTRTSRPLTPAEERALSPGLLMALEDAGAAPLIVAAPHPAALLSALWRGQVPVLTHGRRVFWPGAAPDLAETPAALAILQHELQHVLEFATGELTAAGYLIHPRNWTYRLRLTDRSLWEDFGAEQRAVVVERLWWAERRGDQAQAAALRRLIPWTPQPC